MKVFSSSVKEIFENYLEKEIAEYPANSLFEPFIYTMQNKGKRVRPILTLMAADSLDNNYEKALYPSDSKILELGYHKVFGKLTEMMPNSPLLTKILRRIARVRTNRIKREMTGKPITLESKPFKVAV